jgi:hypothetical protein
VSSFKNDVGYISESALNTWLKAHSYLSKNEINALISKANLVVVDKINKTYDDDALALLTEKVNDLAGEVTAIKDKLTGFISIDKEDSFATKSDLSGVNSKITNINTKLGNINIQISQINTTTSQKADKSEIPTKVSQLENDIPYLTQQNLNGFVKESKLTSTLKDYAKKSSLPAGTIATQEWIDSQHFLTEEQDLSNLVQKQDLNSYVKNSVLNDKLATVAKKSDLNDYASKQWVNDQHFLTEEQDLSNFVQKQDLNSYVKNSALNDKLATVAKKSDISGMATQKWVNEQGFLKSESQDLSGFATKSWVEGKNYVTPSQLGQYAKKSELSQYAKKTDVYTKDQINSTFPTKKAVSDIYITKDEVRKGYLRIEDYRGLKDATVINDSYKDETVDEFKSHINNLMSGFYIVNQTDVIIVKKRPDGTCEVVSMFKDGIPQIDTTIYWETD